MKKLLFLYVLLCTYTARGQFIKHADTATLTDPHLIAMRNEIETQRAWFESLTISEQTYKRLEKEYSRIAIVPTKNTTIQKRFRIKKQYIQGDISLVDDKVIKQEILSRRKLVHTSHYNIVSVRFLGFRIFVGDTEDTSGFSYIAQYTRKNNNPSVNAKTGEPLNFPVLIFQADPGEISFKSLFYTETNEYMGTPTHEFSHMSTDIDFSLYNETIKILRNITQTDTLHKPLVRNIRTQTTYSYIDDPSEIKACIDATRYCLYKTGLYDARTQKFTRKHLRMLLQNKELLQNSDINKLLKNVLLKKKHLIWMMNNIAINKSHPKDLEWLFCFYITRCIITNIYINLYILCPTLLKHSSHMKITLNRTTKKVSRGNLRFY